MKLKIISFGSDPAYIDLAEKTVKSVQNLYSNCVTQVFKPEDLSNEINNYAKKTKRIRILDLETFYY